MPEGRWRFFAALSWGVALVLGRFAAAEPPPPANHFEVLPGLTDDAPASPIAPPAACETHAPEGDQSGVYVAAEYLLLKPRRGDLDFAILNRNQSGHPDGTVETLSLGTVSSFRLNAGYRLDNKWDVGASYSYLFSRGQAAVNGGPDGTVYATRTHPESVEQAATAVGDVRLNYNVLDFEVGRRLAFGDDFGVRVFGGGRSGFINQHLSATYNGRDANNDGTYSRVDFDGVGLRVGAECEWRMGRGFTLYARAAGSLVGGRFEVEQTETNGTATLLNVADKFEKVVPVTEYAVGIGWQRNNIRVRLGYEMTNWGNLVDRPDFVDDVHRGKLVRRTSDLSLDGLSFQVGIGY